METSTAWWMPCSWCSVPPEFTSPTAPADADVTQPGWPYPRGGQPQDPMDALGLGPAHRRWRAPQRAQKGIHRAQRKLGLHPALDTP